MGLFSNLFGKRDSNAPKRPRTNLVRTGAISSLPATVNAGMGQYFEALRDSKDRTPISPLYMSAYYWLMGLGRERLAALGRYLYDNLGPVSYAVDQVANYSVPLLPQAASSDPAWNTDAEGIWNDWTPVCDFTRRFHFDTLQRLICKAIDIEGDIGVGLTLEDNYPKVILTEGWRINSNRAQVPRNFDGVQLDEQGRVMGYWIDKLPSPDFVDFNGLFLMYDPDRYSSYRGVSPLRRGSNDIRDAQDIKAFEKLATKIRAAMPAVIEGSPLEENVWGNDTGTEGDPGTAPEAATDPTELEKKLTIAELLGGDIPVLPEGQVLKQLENDRPGDRTVDFLTFLGGQHVMGLGIPPAFYLDEKLTGPNARSVNGKAQRKFDQRQEMHGRLIEWLWVRVIGWNIAIGRLPAVPGWNRVSWQGPPKLTIDAGRESAQERDDLMNGLMTRQNHYANRGLNWKRETDQGFDEDDYIIGKAMELAKKHGLPVEMVLKRWGFEKPQAPQQNQQQNQQQQEAQPAEEETE